MFSFRLLIKGSHGSRSYSSLSMLSKRFQKGFHLKESESTLTTVNLDNCCFTLKGNDPYDERFSSSLPIFYNQKRFYDSRGISKEKKGKTVKYEMSDEELSKVIPVEEFEAYLSSIYSKLKNEFTTQFSLRSGFGIETLPVELDGSTYQLKELAQLSKKSSNLMVLNLGSLPEAIKPVLTAINSSGMNLSPQQDGSKIFLTLPKVTREHRENLAKGAKTFLNSAKQEINQLQNRYIEIASQSNKPSLGRDTIRDAADNIRARSQEMIKKCEELFKLKTKELLDE